MGVKQLLDGRRESDLEEKTSIVEGNDEISKELRENTTKNEIGRGEKQCILSLHEN